MSLRKTQVIAVILVITFALASCRKTEERHGRKETEETSVQTEGSQTSSSESSAEDVRTDIYDIADLEWAVNSSPVFSVSTPAQFAGVVRFLNEHEVEDFVLISIEEDLDLDGYDWLPIDRFNGNIFGGGHTISNIHLTRPVNEHNGLIGCNAGGIGIFDLTIENAEVTGGEYAGIVVGEGYLLNFVDVYASGTVDSQGEFAGALIGRTSPSTTYGSCSMDVTVNGKRAEYFSYTQQNESRADDFATDIYTLTLDSDYTVHRTDEDYDPWNLAWRVIYNGEIVLERNAEDEFEYRYFRSDPGEYKIYLIEYNAEYGGYVRVSNIVGYTA